jgi:hypothetical protein
MNCGLVGPSLQDSYCSVGAELGMDEVGWGWDWGGS